MQTVLKELELFIENQDYNFLDKNQLEFANKIQSKIIKLKEIERSQIIEAFENGVNCGVENEYAFSDLHAQNYYAKTFKND